MRARGPPGPGRYHYIRVLPRAHLFKEKADELRSQPSLTKKKKKKATISGSTESALGEWLGKRMLIILSESTINREPTFLKSGDPYPRPDRQLTAVKVAW